jgi:hypothetical protein
MTHPRIGSILLRFTAYTPAPSQIRCTWVSSDGFSPKKWLFGQPAISFSNQPSAFQRLATRWDWNGGIGFQGLKSRILRVYCLPPLADGLSQTYRDLLTGSCDCIDRIVLNGYYRLGHDHAGFRG